MKKPYSIDKIKEKFLVRAKSIFGDRFDYYDIYHIGECWGRQEYEIDVKCREHGEFFKCNIRLHVQMLNGGCPTCAKAQASKPKTWDETGKVCSKCGEKKDLNQFGKTTKRGFQRVDSWCKECKSNRWVQYKNKPGVRDRLSRKRQLLEKFE